jgi:hypothetical protein
VGKWVGDYSGASDSIAVLNQWHQRSYLDRLADTQAVPTDHGMDRTCIFRLYFFYVSESAIA